MRFELALRVNMAVVTVTTTGRCTSAHKGMLTCGSSRSADDKSQSSQRAEAVA